MSATPLTGADLVRASQKYAVEERSRTWFHLVTTLLVYVTCLGLAAAGSSLIVQGLGALGAGLTLIRLFIFYHDYQHGAILKDSTIGRIVMTVVGYLTLAPPPVWRETHDYHHRNNAKMPGTTIGSYPVVTLAMWRGMTRRDRFWYRFARHPLTIAFGYVTIFMLGMCIASFRRDGRRHWQSLFALLVHLGLVLLVAMALSPTTSLLAIVLPTAMANTIGAYLFYAQHNFPSMVLDERRHWDFSRAALKASSMFDMSPLMHWFTGNIGYHHVHHLNHRIPFYRLPEAMADMPELQQPGRTSWHPRDVAACFALAVWDSHQQRMLTWREVRALDAVEQDVGEPTPR